MTDSFRDRHALVTGGGRGIGRAIAAALVEAGAKVTVVGRDTGPLGDAVRAGHAHGFAAADVTDAIAVQRAADIAAEDRGPIDFLVANAGGVETGAFVKSDAAVFQRMLNLNVMGAVNSIRAVLPVMIERGFGRIVAVSSTAGLKGYAYVSAYCAAKHAVVGLVRALALETAKKGVTVNAVCPGYTETDLVKESFESVSEKTGRPYDDVLAEVLKDKPLGRLVRPEEVAAATLFLLDPAASAVTGQAVAVAGGEV
jgi:NAD(P)-dependent dehydrogenase (short-subunit alcohol dehydrogenase family)